LFKAVVVSELLRVLCGSTTFFSSLLDCAACGALCTLARRTQNRVNAALSSSAPTLFVASGLAPSPPPGLENSIAKALYVFETHDVERTPTTTS
jgi:hypothetical protein